jgi:hypothetical protein
MVEGVWSDDPIDVPEDSTVCLYPRASSSADGAWLVQSAGGRDVWTLALPIAVLNTRSREVLDTLWRIGEISLPCLAGEEYSMHVARCSAMAVLVEAADARSLATHAVVRGVGTLKDWSVLRRDGDMFLLARNNASADGEQR